jgi:hypothetical protein
MYKQRKLTNFVRKARGVAWGISIKYTYELHLPVKSMISRRSNLIISNTEHTHATLIKRKGSIKCVKQNIFFLCNVKIFLTRPTSTNGSSKVATTIVRRINSDLFKNVSDILYYLYLHKNRPTWGMKRYLKIFEAYEVNKTVHLARCTVWLEWH